MPNVMFFESVLSATNLRAKVVDEILEEPSLACTLCGRPLGYNPDDQPYWPTGPMCGDCYQAREMDNDIWAAELNDETEL